MTFEQHRDNQDTSYSTVDNRQEVDKDQIVKRYMEMLQLYMEPGEELSYDLVEAYIDGDENAITQLEQEVNEKGNIYLYMTTESLFDSVENMVYSQIENGTEVLI